MPHPNTARRRPATSLRRIRARPSASPNLYEGDEHVLSVQNLSYINQHAKGGRVFAVKFFVGWCGHCQALSPTWRSFAALACAASSLQVAAIDCVTHAGVCRAAQISSYPTLRLFGEGLPQKGFSVARCKKVRKAQKCATGGEEMLKLILKHPVARAAAGGTPHGLMSRARARGCRPSRPASLHTHTGDLIPGQEPIQARQWPLPLIDLGSAALWTLQQELPRKPLGSRWAARIKAAQAWIGVLSDYFPHPGDAPP